MSKSFFKLKIKKDPTTGYCLASLYYKGETRNTPYLDIPYEDYVKKNIFASDTCKWLEEHLENKASELSKKGTEHIPTEICRYIRSVLPERSMENAEKLRYDKTRRKGIPSLKKHVKAYKKYCKKQGTDPVTIARYVDPYVLIETNGQRFLVQSQEGIKAELLSAVKNKVIDFYHMCTEPQVWDEVITDPGIPTPKLVATMLEIWADYCEENETIKEKDKLLLSLKDFFKNSLDSLDIATEAYVQDMRIFGILIQAALSCYNTEDTIDEYIDLLFSEYSFESVYDEFLITVF